MISKLRSAKIKEMLRERNHCLDRSVFFSAKIIPGSIYLSTFLLFRAATSIAVIAIDAAKPFESYVLHFTVYSISEKAFDT